MPHPTPPRRRGGSRTNVSAARRRQSDQLSPTGGAQYGPATPGSKPRPPASEPPRVLGSTPQPITSTTDQGDTRLEGQQYKNAGTPEAAAVGWGASRVGHRFTVGFTPDGNIVHLYGSNVPAADRRVVLNAAQTAAAKRKLGI